MVNNDGKNNMGYGVRVIKTEHGVIFTVTAQAVRA